eukprot:scaffold23058_cov20-Tisochrysis_lutea.AAC.4
MGITKPSKHTQGNANRRGTTDLHTPGGDPPYTSHTLAQSWTPSSSCTLTFTSIRYKRLGLHTHLVGLLLTLLRPWQRVGVEATVAGNDGTPHARLTRNLQQPLAALALHRQGGGLVLRMWNGLHKRTSEEKKEKGELVTRTHWH